MRMYAFVGDIHLGTKLSQMDYLKSLNKFLELIKQHKEECHCIFICGDLFDHKMTIEESKFAAVFMINLVCNHCGRNGRTHVPVHFIHGTYTHDYDQYEIFLPMLEKIPNVDIFYTNKACSGNLRNGTSVLYLPQEYGDIDYTDALNKSYDIIIGHGPISSQTMEPCKSTQYEILHSAEQLGSLSKICVFGHYHGYTDFGNNTYYTGPWLRWKYGEDIKRVFFFCDDNFKVELHDNEFALKYETICINSPDELREAVSQEFDNPHRYVINCENSELQEYHSIMNAYKKNELLSYQIHTNKLVEEERDIERIEETTVTPNIEPIPSLIEYIKDKYNIDATLEIKDYEMKINREE